MVDSMGLITMKVKCADCEQDKDYWFNSDAYSSLYIDYPQQWICKDCYKQRDINRRLEWEHLDKECPLPIIEDGIEWGCDKMDGNKDIEKLRKHITQKHTKTQMVEFIIENIRLWET
jgi:hypothetical protein